MYGFTTKGSKVKSHNRYLTLEQANQALEVLTPILGKVRYNEIAKNKVKGKTKTINGVTSHVYKDTGYRSLKWYVYGPIIFDACKAMNNLDLGYYYSPRNSGSFRIMVPREFNYRKWIDSFEPAAFNSMLFEAKEKTESAIDETAPEFVRAIVEGVRNIVK